MSPSDPLRSQFDAARVIADDPAVLAVYAAPEFDELSDDGKTWIAAIVERAMEAGREEARDEGGRLRTAFHDAIHRPMGIVPGSGEEFFDIAECQRAAERRPGVERTGAP